MCKLFEIWIMKYNPQQELRFYIFFLKNIYYDNFCRLSCVIIGLYVNVSVCVVYYSRIFFTRICVSTTSAYKCELCVCECKLNIRKLLLMIVGRIRFVSSGGKITRFSSAYFLTYLHRWANNFMTKFIIKKNQPIYYGIKFLRWILYYSKCFSFSKCFATERDNNNNKVWT